MESIRYIKKVEIKNLWNKYDIEWNLNEDINILALGFFMDAINETSLTITFRNVLPHETIGDLIEKACLQGKI